MANLLLVISKLLRALASISNLYFQMSSWREHDSCVTACDIVPWCVILPQASSILMCGGPLSSNLLTRMQCPGSIRCAPIAQAHSAYVPCLDPQPTNVSCAASLRVRIVGRLRKTQLGGMHVNGVGRILAFCRRYVLLSLLTGSHCSIGRLHDGSLLHIQIVGVA